MKKILIALALILFFGGGVYLTKKYYTWNEIKAKESSQVLLEKIKNVYKLVTVMKIIGAMTLVFFEKKH